MEKILGVIPARWASTRFPGKPLCDIAGKSLIHRVWERCCQCQYLDQVIVATDDERIRQAALDFGAQVAMTRDDHPSGTDRMAEVAEQLPQYPLLINIQGDEPLIDPGLIDGLGLKLREDPEIDLITAANPLAWGDPALENPHVVKVVLDNRGRALYFSRSGLPHPRTAPVEGITPLQHKGIYGYRRSFLEQFVGWPPGKLEQVEGLEQLRALENGGTIAVVLTEDRSPGVDTPEQARMVSAQIQETLG
ncbi:MAG: 3-deoxy-manno-octulosonate cytidylyltransferase [Verrucomicrobiota bacterium]